MNEKQKIRDYLITLVGKNIAFSDDDSLISSQLIDSLSVANLVVFLQDTYQFTFDNEELNPENLDSVNAIMDFLQQKAII
jgi:acyl carrier protein